MCDCEIYSSETMKPIKVDYGEEHSFVYGGSQGEVTLLEKIKLAEMNYNKAFCKRIKDEHGFKDGYMFIFGEQE